MFGAPDYYFLACDPSSCGPATPTEDPSNAWNHGGIQSDIGHTWLGMVGPGVRRTGGAESDDSDENESRTAIEFSDHTDVRPTVLALTGLQDDYPTDGRVLIEAIDHSALPDSVRDHSGTLVRLGRLYKRINAPFGELGLTSLKVSTFALASSSGNDQTFTNLETKIAAWHKQRDSLAGQMKALLDDALHNKRISEEQARDLNALAEALLDQVHACAADVADCAL
jgi:hypothetical protein